MQTLSLILFHLAGVGFMAGIFHLAESNINRVKMLRRARIGAAILVLFMSGAVVLKVWG